MCGIYASLSISQGGNISPGLTRRLCNRGPDHLGQHSTTLIVGTSQILLSFTSTVLSLRGDHVTKQPFVHEESGSVFCWNGEGWKLRGEAIAENDGVAVFNDLVTAQASGHNAILNTMRDIEGPFAFVFFSKPNKCLYYGRDRLGRRSLLVNGSSDFILSSITDIHDPSWKEVEADGIYSFDIAQWFATSGYCPSRNDWLPTKEEEYVSSLARFNVSIPGSGHRLEAQSRSVKHLRSYLTESLRLRVLNIPDPPGVTSDEDSRVAILFSGGLDCTVLARIAHELLPNKQAIDLLNVAFENPRVAAQMPLNKDGSRRDVYEACPDRITGRKSFEELTKVCSSRTWRFVAVNIPYTETQTHRAAVVSLIYPHNTEMDLSIAYALYFSSRGQGTCQAIPGGETWPYSTTARVLLSGLGADELFGGYVRHMTGFSRRGYPGLIEELKLDVSRLGKRNLGRDDRVICHWGREVRFPYLDESLVKWAVGLPVWEKCDFHNAESEGLVEPGKRVLRLLAEELGMTSVAREKKRAIQFGSRTAKMETGKVKGTTLIS